MPVSFSLTDEGDLYLLGVLDERLAAGDIKLWPLIGAWAGDPEDITWDDVSAITHPDFTTSSSPGFNSGPYLSTDFDGGTAGNLTWTEWRAVNNSGATRTLHGFVIVDEMREKVLFCFTTSPEVTTADGEYREFDLTVTTDLLLP